jgi:hypothetical protein
MPFVYSRPTQWFTPTSGLPYRSESVRATRATDCSGAPIPGPTIPNRSVESTNWIRNDAGLAFGIANAVQVVHTDTRFRDGILNDFESPLSMMYSCVARKEPFAGRCDVGMPDV